MDEKLSDNILTGLDGIVTVNGQLKQIHVLSGIQKQAQYQLSYEVIELVAEKNYVLSYLTYEDGTVHTYFFPIQFIGPQKIVFDVPFPVTNIQFSINGRMKIKDTKLKSVLTDALTEEEKIALGKVSTNSDYWDRIIAVTSALGNVLTDKLEGSINTALNSIAGSSGRMYWEDGKFICRDGTTDETSTMAMLLSPAGFMIADSKKVDGAWDWRTFGTGKGFVADEIIAGTLRAIAIEGVSITASTLTGGEIIGARIKGGSLNIADKYIVDSDGDVQMLGNITWGATNSPVKVKYSSDNTSWHYDFLEGDTFAKYSYDGGLTWTVGIKIRGTDGDNGIPGSSGAQGPPGQTGPQGPAGNDAQVPSYIQSTKITGTTVESCTIKGTTILGCTVKGSTIIGGNEADVYTRIDDTSPLAVYRPTGKVAELWGATDGSSYFKLYNRYGIEKIALASGASAGSISSLTDTGSFEMTVAQELAMNGVSGFKIRAWNRADPYIEIYRSYMNVGHRSAETYIDGSTVYINSKVSGYAFSENEVRMMELEYENTQLGIKQSNLEVTLMERGIL